MTYTITVTGKGGHGSRPDLSINPIDCLAAIHLALGRLPGFQVKQINAGTSGNVIPAQAIMTFRSGASQELICQIMENSAKPFRCTATLDCE